MGKAVKIILIVLLVLALLAFAAGLGLQHMAKQPETLAQVPGAPEVALVSNGVVYFYLIQLDNGRAVMIDAGLDGSGELLGALTDYAGSDPAAIEQVFITHGHNDHFNGLPAVPDAEVIAGAADVALLEGRVQKDGIGPLILNTLFELNPVTPDRRLRGRETIELSDGSQMIALPFPGHTPGSYLYFHEGVLYIGDAFNYAEGRFTWPPDFVTMDMPQTMRSVAGMEDSLENIDVLTVCTGHGGCTEPEETAELLQNFIESARRSTGI